MAERLQIWNAALAHIGDGTVLADLADPSTVANEIRRVYATNRDALLAEFPWRWAERVTALAPYVPVPPGTRYAYQLPSGCLGVRKVSMEPEPNAPSVPWRLSGATNSAGDDVQIIVSDHSPLYARFTKLVESEAVWPRPFATAMEWRLAWAISYPITRDLPRRQEAWAQFLGWMAVAQAEDQRQVYERRKDAPWIEARDGPYVEGFPEDAPDYTRLFPVA